VFASTADINRSRLRAAETKEKIRMSEFQIANDNGSTPTLEPTTMKRYFVPVEADVQMTLTGTVEVYAMSEAEASAKVREQIDTDTLSDDLEMEDAWSGCVLDFGVVTQIDGVNIEVNSAAIKLDHSEVTPEEVLRTEIREWESLISWDADALARHKMFLESLSHSEVA
jgi:hypothetical protein